MTHDPHLVSPGPSARRRWTALAASAVCALAAGLLYWLPPTEGSLYPRCLFHSLTGLHCPGCGTTRCLHALLHGDVCAAAAQNLLTLGLLPLVLWWGFRHWLAALTGSKVKPRPLPGWSVGLLGVIVVVFCVLRNLGVPPFSLLAPHAL
ncbi:MAG TPA: DUF2752 domain-containing protein [Gemmataceae bacterium]|nr:DUF2752 domain-containing protein [Gemmataceae bacterium]